MRAVVRRVGGPERARRMVSVGLLVATIGLVGTCAAGSRLQARIGTRTGSASARTPLLGSVFDFFHSSSPDGVFSAVIRKPAEFSGDQTVLVIDRARGTEAGRFPRREGNARIRDVGWRDASTLWFSAEEYFGECVEAFSASAPDWQFAADDCERPPADVGQDRSWGAGPSPDGALIATQRFDRRGPWDFGDAAPGIPDVRLTDADGRFLVQLGDLSLVGWNANGNLMVHPVSEHRPFEITRAQIDALLLRVAG